MDDVIIFQAAQNPLLFAQICRLRYKVFCEHLGWTIPSVDSLEFDEFDVAATHCALVDNGSVIGYWRALPTTSPYLLQKSFSILLRGDPAPCSELVWEISRFAMDPLHTKRWEFGRRLAYAFVNFGNSVGAEELIGVTEPSFERFLRACGLIIKRTSGPVVMGHAKGRPVYTTMISCPLSRQNSLIQEYKTFDDLKQKEASHAECA